MSMSFALSICVLFISLMQSVNRAQFLVIIFFLTSDPAFRQTVIKQTFHD